MSFLRDLLRKNWQIPVQAGAITAVLMVLLVWQHDLPLTDGIILILVPTLLVLVYGLLISTFIAPR